MNRSTLIVALAHIMNNAEAILYNTAVPCMTKKAARDIFDKATSLKKELSSTVPAPKAETIINVTMSKSQLDELVDGLETDIDDGNTNVDAARLYGKLKDTQELAEAAEKAAVSAEV